MCDKMQCGRKQTVDASFIFIPQTETDHFIQNKSILWYGDVNVSSLTQLSITNGFLCEILISVSINQNKESCNVCTTYRQNMCILLTTALYNWKIPTNTSVHLIRVPILPKFYLFVNSVTYFSFCFKSRMNF